MNKTLIAATLAAALAGSLAMTGTASAKKHKHYGWHGGTYLVLGGDYGPDCYTVKKYTNYGKPYWVEVCE